MLFDLARSLGSLTASPIQTALDQARRQAQRFEAGGAASSDHADGAAADGYVLPPDIDPELVVTAIATRLGVDTHKRPVPEAVAGGRVVIPRAVVGALGNGVLERGRRVLERIVAEARRTRRHR